MAVHAISPAAIPTAVAALLIIGYALYRAALPRPIPGIPFNSEGTRTLMGDIARMKKELRTAPGTPAEWMAAQSMAFDSPIYQLFFPLTGPKVFVVDHREGLDIMLRRGKEFDRSRSFANFFRGTLPNSHMVMATSDPRFKAQRKLVADTMTPTFLATVAARQVHRQALHLMDLWRTKEHMCGSHPYLVGHDINQMALDSIWAVAFGTEINTVKTQRETLERHELQIPVGLNAGQPIELPKPKLPQAYESIMVLAHDLEAANTTRFPRFSHWRKRQTMRWKTAKTHKDLLMQESLNSAKYRLLHSNSREDMVDCATDLMVFREQQAAVKENRAPQYDSLGARDELFTFLFAGHETSSTAIQWGVKFLADNPEVQSKLRSALQIAYPEYHLSGTIPSGEAIANVQVAYLDATIEEILRLGLVISRQSREALCDTEVLGCRIPKGTEVVFMNNGPGFVRPNPFVSRIQERHRSRSSQANKDKVVPEWDTEDISEFKPERWLKLADHGAVAFDPKAGPTSQFGAGERGCFGRRLAYIQLRIILTMIIWSFELPKLSEALSSYKAVTTSTRQPKICYARPIPLR